MLARFLFQTTNLCLTSSKQLKDNNLLAVWAKRDLLVAYTGHTPVTFHQNKTYMMYCVRVTILMRIDRNYFKCYKLAVFQINFLNQFSSSKIMYCFLKILSWKA